MRLNETETKNGIPVVVRGSDKIFVLFILFINAPEKRNFAALVLRFSP